jgi:HPt (histidine-containing phosphotransfer) domain-containing protein
MPICGLVVNEIPVPVLDRAFAEARVGGDAELLRELAALFLEEYPRLLEAIRAALAAGDARALERAAHGLKGSVANFGAPAAVAAALALEQAGKRGELPGAGERLARLECVLETLRSELAAL